MMSFTALHKYVARRQVGPRLAGAPDKNYYIAR